jgi:hypothetical protein
LLTADKKRQIGVYGGEQIGRRLSFLDSEATEEEEEEEEKEDEEEERY